MANYQKFTQGSIHNLFAHFDRSLSNNSNKQIDSSRTHLNYNLHSSELSQEELLKNRLNQVKVLKRADVNVLTSWVITLPKDFNGDQAKFFQASYDFLSKKYGAENVISAYVHRDETTPHLHFAWVPVVEDAKKGIQKVSAKECVKKSDLQNFHRELEGYLSKNLEQPIHMMNGATANGNETIRELKLKTAEKDLQRKAKQISEREKKIMATTNIFPEPPEPKKMEFVKNYYERMAEWWKGVRKQCADFVRKYRLKNQELEKKEKALQTRENQLKDMEKEIRQYDLRRYSPQQLRELASAKEQPHQNQTKNKNKPKRQQKSDAWER